jgi:hypothetical protein
MFGDGPVNKIQLKKALFARHNISVSERWIGRELAALKKIAGKAGAPRKK